MAEIFDDWPERYDQWFETPIGKLVKEVELQLLLEMVQPVPGELILDAGCGTGVFARDFLAAGVRIVGMELSFPMLERAVQKLESASFYGVQADMRRLPFADASFHKVMSVTAIEFLEDARSAVDELFRVTRHGGLVVVAGLNSLSPWAARRRAEAEAGHPIFRHARFRSPAQVAALAPFPAVVRTAVHFQKQDDPEAARGMERDGQASGLDTGAFLVVRWRKPQHFTTP